jgi:hypothetical protein
VVTIGDGLLVIFDDCCLVIVVDGSDMVLEEKILFPIRDTSAIKKGSSQQDTLAHKLALQGVVELGRSLDGRDKGCLK